MTVDWEWVGAGIEVELPAAAELEPGRRES